MDRFIVLQNEQADSVDLLKTNKNTYISVSKLAAALLGNTTWLNGFTCTPSSPPNMDVIVSGGEIYQMAAIDTTAYGILPTDSHQILKQGVNLDAVPPGTFTFTAPATPGQSVNYLIEFKLQEGDVQEENRVFFSGPPQLVPTIRQDSVFIKQLDGSPATTGSQVTPTPDTGYVGGFVITVAHGQTEITTDDISIYPGAPFIAHQFGDFITQAFADGRYSQIATVQNNGYNYATATGPANTYAVNLNPAIAAYTAGMTFDVLINATSTGASTINVNSKGATTILRRDGGAIQADDLLMNTIARFMHNGTNVICLDPPRNIGLCRAHQTVSQGIAPFDPVSPLYTVMLFQVVDFDQMGAFRTSDGTFEPDVAGYYEISANLCFDGAGGIGITIWQNGVPVSTTIPNGNGDCGGCVWDIIYFNGTTDYVYVTVANFGSTVITTSPSTARSNFKAKLISL
jgi:hypothetical protein